MLKLAVSIVIGVVMGGIVSAQPPQRFGNFEQLSTVMVAKIMAAKQRVWLISSFMSDYDISLALYLAAKRKRDVRVVLGQERAQDMLSQYDYLRTQQVIVRLATAVGSTVLICDGRMYRLNRDLDFLSEHHSYVLRRIAQPDIHSYALALGVIDVPVHGEIYDYSRKQHRQPDYISGRLPQQTIRTQKSSGGSS